MFSDTVAACAGEREDTSGSRVLVVDDSSANVSLLRQLLTRDGYHVVAAADGVDAMTSIEKSVPDIVLSDVIMPRQDGIELCRRLKADTATRLIPVVLLTSLNGRDARIRGIEAGADDFLVKPFDPHELRARVRSLLRLKRYTDELDTAEAVILSLARTVEARDPHTEGHCQRLSTAAAMLGRRLDLPVADIAALERGGVLHDIGKIGIPDAILLKQGRLTPDEFEVMKTHTVIGDRLCSDLRFLRSVRPIVRHHHERPDGTGYPDGLRGGAIPLLAQIIGVADVFDALTSVRPYKPALSADQALEEMEREVRNGWRDAELVDQFAAMIRGRQ
jgi:putative two-component system response regulator